MTLLTIYILSCALIIFFIYKLGFSLKRKSNPFIQYFFWTLVIYAAGEIVGLILVISYLRTNNGYLLYLLDVSSRLSTYLGSFFILQIPFYLYEVNKKTRYIISAAFLTLSLLFFIYNLSFHYQPILDSSGAVHWQAPLGVSVGYALISLSAWIPTAVAFLIKWFQKRSINLLFLSIGFFLTSCGTVLQDFSKTNLQYNLLYAALFIGAIFTILGFTNREKSKAKA